ncbi:hypothetical protein H312_02552 [Anncaliia algerae PRA339]|uniref:Uncharacterized protein n=1 Tax=Anncaliia algerae PRA339 TaxID=1288291 RepID=A0A059EZ77_9MICR|nr:hypothetical protein H312_02552 [Anncaliia algerae PRA339]
MKEKAVLIFKSITNLSLAFLILLIHKPMHRYKVVWFLITLINPIVYGIRYYKLEVKHNSMYLRKIYYVSFFIELFLIILYYTFTKKIVGIVNVLFIGVIDFVFFYHKKKNVILPKKIVEYDLAKCISQCIQNGKLILYKDEIVFVLDKYENKMHIRKSNGDEYLVDNTYLIEYNTKE